MDELKHIKSKALSEIASAMALAELDEVRVRYLGKKGELTGLLKGLGKLPVEERPVAGADINKFHWFFLFFIMECHEEHRLDE